MHEMNVVFEVFISKNAYISTLIKIYVLEINFTRVNNYVIIVI